MGFFSRCLLVGLAVSATAAASSSPRAVVYTFDSTLPPPPPPRDAPTLDPHAARLVISRRLGLSQNDQLGGASEDRIQHLNDFGGRQQPLLEEENEQTSSLGRLLLMVEGVDFPETIITPSRQTPSFFMSHPPGPEANKILAEHLSSSASLDAVCSKESAQKEGYRGHLSYTSIDGSCCSVMSDPHRRSPYDVSSLYPEVELHALTPDQWCGGSMTSVVHFTALKHIHHRSSLNPEFSSAMAYLLEVIDFLERSARSGDQESTVIFFPPSTPTGNSRDPSYGDLTQLHTPQKSKRQNQSPEEPLEPQPTPTPSTRPHSNGTVPPPPPMLPSPGSFIPVCHASHEACETATGACFGHGSCEKKYETTGEDGRSHRACFACACKPSLVETGGSGGKGRKTIHWGGAACQKKDVSSPFFLLAGLTVLLIAVISWGIGLLFSVGQEDLPSVIGAGVSGPKAR